MRSTRCDTRRARRRTVWTATRDPCGRRCPVRAELQCQHWARPAFRRDLMRLLPRRRWPRTPALQHHAVWPANPRRLRADGIARGTAAAEPVDRGPCSSPTPPVNRHGPPARRRRRRNPTRLHDHPRSRVAARCDHAACRRGGDGGGPVGRAHLDATLGATPHEPQWRAHFRKIVRAFGARLFPCHDQPQIPRTNNDMERRCAR